jgi:hypothetical protein
MRQNHRMIRCDACHPPSAWGNCRQPVQVAATALPATSAQYCSEGRCSNCWLRPALRHRHRPAGAPGPCLDQRHSKSDRGMDCTYSAKMRRGGSQRTLRSCRNCCANKKPLGQKIEAVGNRSIRRSLVGRRAVIGNMQQRIADLAIFVLGCCESHSQNQAQL